MIIVTQSAPWSDVVEAGNILTLTVTAGTGAYVQRSRGADALESVNVTSSRAFGPYLRDMTFRVSAMLGATVTVSEATDTGQVLDSTKAAAAAAAVQGAGIENPAPLLPNLIGYVVTQDDTAPVTIKGLSVGSSVGVGATLPDPTTQAPGAFLTLALTTALNKLGNLTLSHTNGCVNGTSITSALNSGTDYASAKTAAGGAGKFVALAYGMNDFQPASYHSGQRYDYFDPILRALIRQIRADGSDPIVMTTPHPHSTRNPWTTLPPSVAYPVSGTQVPGPTYAASVIIGDHLGTGISVPASYRHKRGNETTRRVCAEMGVALIDVERYWFAALATYGEDALFDTGEYAHPNLLGHQQSYQAAITAFCNSLSSARILSTPAPILTNDVIRKTATTTHNTITLADDAELKFTAAINATYDVECIVYYSVPTGADLKAAFSMPSGAAGRMSLQGGAYDTPTNITTSSVSIVGNTLFAGGTGAEAVATIRATVRTGSTQGTVALQLAQFVATGTNTIFLDSLMRVRRIA